MRKNAILFLFCVLVLISDSGNVYGKSEILSLTIELDENGVADIEYIFDVENMEPPFQLIGSSFENIRALNQDGDLLEYNITGNTIIFTRNNTKIGYLFYKSDTLVSRLNETLSRFEALAPTPVILIIPDVYVIEDIQPYYLSISIIDDKPTIVMPSGLISLNLSSKNVGSYMQTVLAINNVRNQITLAKQVDLRVTEAELFLALAENSFSESKYIEALEYANQALESVNETIVFVESLRDDYYSVLQLLETAENVDQEYIDEVDLKMVHIDSLIESGNYQAAYDEIQLARSLILDNEKRAVNWVTVLLIMVVAVISYVYHINRRREVPEEEDDYSYLRSDDRAVIIYLKNNGGAFITDIRDRFDLPKSSSWRMMKRLEEMGLIETSIIGRETYVKLIEK